MGQHFTKTDHRFLLECQSQLTQLDEILLGIVSSVDSLHITFTQLLRQLGEVDSDKRDGLVENIELTKKLMLSVEDGLCHQKTTLLQQISQFARMIKTKSDPGRSISKTIPALDSLKIDTYLSSGKIPDFSDARKQSIDGEIPGKLAKAKEHSNEDNERVIKSLKEEKMLCAEQMKSFRDQNEQLIRENEELKTSLIKLEKESIQLLPVQLYCQKRSDQMGMVLQEIMTQLGGNEQFSNKQLAYLLCEKSTDVHQNLPILALCFNASRIGTDALNAINGIKQPENTALLIFHHRDEHALPNQSSDRVLVDQEFKALGGIFDIGFLAGKGIYLCEKNTSAIAGIMRFLEKVLTENVIRIQTSRK